MFPRISVRMSERSKVMRNFFDRDKVLEKMRRAERKPLDQCGSYVRRTAKGLIRPAAKGKLEKVKKARLAYERARRPTARKLALQALVLAQRSASSPVNTPPRSVKGHLKNNIFFAWDDSTRSVVIGPVKLGAGVAPAALEYGGPSVTKIRRNNQTISRSVIIRKRPYMHPAFDKEIPKFPALFENCLARAA